LFNIDNQVNNVMDSDGLGRFLSVLQTDHNRPVCEILLFTLATAARIGNVLSCRWSDLDLDARIWRVDQETAKAKRTQYIVINDVAYEILKRNQSDNEFVFINKNTGTRYTTITRVFHRIRKAAGLPKLRIHDLRHQAATIMAAENHSLYTVSKVLTQADERVAARYSHVQSASLQAASGCVSDKIMEAMKAASGEN
jgi:integrase